MKVRRLSTEKEQDMTTIPFGPAAPQNTPLTGGATMPQTQPAAAAAAPILKVTQKRKLPTGIASNVHQHVVICRDRSTSMGGVKLRELNLASVAIGREFADPVNKDGFVVTIVDFGHDAQVVAKAKKATTLTMPEAICNGGTNFNAALRATIDEIKDFVDQPNDAGVHYLRPAVLFLSDGQSIVSDQSIAELHELADVTAVAYGSDAAQDTLRRVSSDGEVHVVGTDGGALRAFFAQVGKTMTQKMTAAN